MSIGMPWITGWKGVAKYIGRSVRTAKTYHYLYSMPVLRMPGGSVAALPYMLDKWLVYFNELKSKKNKKTKI